MNMEAMQRTLDSLKKADPKKFNMSQHGTCILHYVGISNNMNDTGPCARDAAKVLGVDPEIMRDLCIFVIGSGYKDLSDIPLSHAIAVFTHFMRTGEVDWTVTKIVDEDYAQPVKDQLIDQQLAEIRLGDEGPVND